MRHFWRVPNCGDYIKSAYEAGNGDFVFALSWFSTALSDQENATSRTMFRARPNTAGPNAVLHIAGDKQTYIALGGISSCQPKQAAIVEIFACVKAKGDT